MGLRLTPQAGARGGAPALVAPEGTLGYGELVARSGAAAARLLAGRNDLGGARIAFLVPPTLPWPPTFRGILRAGGVAVPLAVSHPEAELAHVLDDAEPEAVVAHGSLAPRIRGLAHQRRLPLLRTEALLRPGPVGDLPDLDDDRPATMLYTSGTTGRPKGVVSTHANLLSQIETLVDAWGWRPDDRALLHLPLHHVHGIVNVLSCALHAGATCEMMGDFDADAVWERLASGEVTVYMAVPTVYRRLLDRWEAADEATRTRWSEGARGLRLMVSGSAALPPPTLERWEEITGHRLLERYGMTEIGMALSNPLDGPRRAGHVGRALPGVQARVVDASGEPVPDGTPGHLEVRGPSVFREYWRRPGETAAAFTDDGWFRTGDEVVVEEGDYRILGRSSVDILKTGGEKVSALEIEDVLRTHPRVADCAVVGVPDPDWGQRVCAAVVAPGGPSPDAEELRAFARERLAPYKVPKEILFVPELPRNAMGKVTKPEVAALFESGAP